MSTYIHAVFFRCRGETSADEINALIRDAVELLGGIPTVRDVRCGRRDAGAVRDVNDTQFHVGLVVTFRDRSDCEAYLEHPAHLAFVQKHRPRWSEVRVCDFAAN